MSITAAVAAVGVIALETSQSDGPRASDAGIDTEVRRDSRAGAAGRGPVVADPMAFRSGIATTDDADVVIYELHVDMHEFGVLHIDGAADRRDERLRMDVTTAGAVPGTIDGDMRVVFDGIGGKVYLSAPGLGVGDGDWVRIPTGDLLAGSGLDGLVRQLGSSPWDVTSILRDRDATHTGDGWIDGVAVREYRTEIPMTLLIDVRQMRRILGGLAARSDDDAGELPDRLPVDVAVGADGFVRRMTYRIDVGGLEIDATMSLRPADDDFRIELPEATAFTD